MEVRTYEMPRRIKVGTAKLAQLHSTKNVEWVTNLRGQHLSELHLTYVAYSLLSWTTEL